MMMIYIYIYIYIFIYIYIYIYIYIHTHIYIYIYIYQRCSQDFFCKTKFEVKTFSSRPRTRLRLLPPRPSSRSRLFLQDHNQDFFLEQKHLKKPTLKLLNHLFLNFIIFKIFNIMNCNREKLLVTREFI